MDIRENLASLGYEVSEFDTAIQAADYMAEKIQGKTVGIGGSVTVEQMHLYEKLLPNNTVYCHNKPQEGMSVMELRRKACRADIYISSVNGIAETGEIVNIDNTGNRVAAISFGNEKVYLVVGENKIAPDYESALYRARNIAAPLNAKRLGVKTPCAAKGDHCYDCKSPQRICRNLSVLWKAPTGCAYEVVLIHEKLGY